MKTIGLNIAILPDEKTKNRAIILSQSIAEMTKSHFVLDEFNYMPHISIYHALYEPGVRNELSKVVVDIAKRTSAFEIKLFSYDYFADYLFLNVLMCNELYDLHMSMLNSCNPLRSQIVPESINELIQKKQIDEQQIALVVKYGHPLTEKYFRPHVTLARLKDSKAVPETIEKLPKQEITMKVSGLGIANIGKHGTCNEVFETFRFN
jgi:2'-5' RNA ligase